MLDFYSYNDIPCFGVAGNFTGHLEQAGEARDFANVKTKDANAPKAVFPTYIPKKVSCLFTENGEAKEKAPAFLQIFPFSSDSIIFPKGEKKVQIEPECAIIFKAVWQGDTLTALKPCCFGASNDCSIRKEGAKKISEKKNWGKCTKGFASHLISLPSSYTFTSEADEVFNRYRIASFLVRGEQVYTYGEDSAVKGYSYFYQKLIDWLLEKFNEQKDEGPAENIHSYLLAAGRPERIMVSVGATRYTSWGEQNFLQAGDKAVVVLYPEDKYSFEEIKAMLESGTLEKEDISALVQTVQI